MIRTTPALVAAPSLACALLLLSASASAQDLAPPSTGEPAADDSAASAPKDGNAKPDDKKADDEKKKDSGRGLEWVYLNAGAGFSYIDMSVISASNLLPGPLTATSNQPSASQGPAFSLGAGLRLFILTLGARATLNELSAFNLWQIDGELGLHIPIGHFEPYFGLHGGYCFVGTLSDGLSGLTSGSQSPAIQISGGDFGAQLGLDYYFNHFVSLGIDVSGSLLFLQRPPAPLPKLPAGVTVPASLQSDYAKSGDSIGAGVAPTLRLGFHL
jgi:hypothetical protein